MKTLSERDANSAANQPYEVSWVKPQRMRGRLDASFYAPKYLQLDIALDAFERSQVEPLGMFLKSPRRILYMSTQTYEAQNAPPKSLPFFSGADLDAPYCALNWTAPLYVEGWMAEKYPKGMLFPGALLIKVKGPNQSAAYVETLRTKALVSGTIFFSGTTRIDPFYLTAFLCSPHGTNWRTRLRTNLTVEFVSNEDLKEMPVLRPPEGVQRAIGSLLRKSVRLREVADKLKEETNELLNSNLAWKSSIVSLSGLGAWIHLDELRHRLDGQYNSPLRLAVIRHFSRHSILSTPLSELAEISAMIGWKGLTTEHYTDVGPYLIRGIDFENGVVHFENLVRVDQAKYDEQPQIHLRAGDVVMTKDGTIGKSLTIPKMNDAMCAGSTVARLRPSSDLRPEFLEAVLNHECVQCQIQSFATGLAQPHITQEWIAELLVPRLRCEDEIADKTAQHHLCLYSARNLVAEAKDAIQSLMAGKLNEPALLKESAQVETWLEANPSPYAKK